MRISLAADHRARDVIEFPLPAYQHCMRPSSNVIVLDCMDAVALWLMADVDLAERIVDTSLDDVDHVDCLDLVADALPIVVELVAVDYAYSALDRMAYSFLVVAVDLADQRMELPAALEHCSVAGLAENVKFV